MFRQIIHHLIACSILLVYENSFAVSEQYHEGNTRNYTPHICYECMGKECRKPYNRTCNDALRCFTHTSLIGSKNVLTEKGCIKDTFLMLALCHDGKAKLDQNETNHSTTCCIGNLCNDDEFILPHIPEYSAPSSRIMHEWMQMDKTNFADLHHFYVFIAGVAITFLFVSLGATCVFHSLKRVSGNEKQKTHQGFEQEPAVNHAYDGFLSSGSGSGLPLMKQRTFVDDLNLIECIGQGRFAEVWKGVLYRQQVAVKIFFSKDEASWKNEVDIYTNLSLYHENILCFRCSGIASRHNVTQMLLVTAFHERGSLYDYLLENTVTLKEMVEFLRSASCGLVHLHKETFAIKGTKKPSIAHRDLKTKNILVNSAGQCVLADFGLAVIKDRESSSTDISVNYQVGTKRYMAPEMLDGSMEVNTFDSYLRADIYAFSLIMWEVCSRYAINGEVEDYRQPFHDCVPSNPDFEDMKKVVCIELKRPEIPDRWSSVEPLDSISNLMKFCWHQKPHARLTAFRLLKAFEKISDMIQ